MMAFHKLLKSEVMSIDGDPLTVAGIVGGIF